MSNSTPNFWIQKLVSYFGWFYLHIIGKTSFVDRYDHPKSLPYRKNQTSVIYAFWHNTQVYLAYDHRSEPIHVMVSRSKDGEYIAQVMNRMNLAPIRGSSSKGAQPAFREMMNLLEIGRQVGITPDGPKGPVYSVSDGVVVAAQKSGLPIIPTSVQAQKKWIFQSWDKFMIPKPFNRIVVAHGEPIYLDPNLDREKAKSLVKSALMDITEQSEELSRNLTSWGALVVGFILLNLYKFLSLAFFPLIGIGLIIKFGFQRSMESIKERLVLKSPDPATSPRIWFHCASIGEWQALNPLLKLFWNEKKWSLFVTVTTPEAKNIIKEKFPELALQLVPLDVGYLWKRFLNNCRPTMLIITETELWPNMLLAASKKFIPTVVVNGRLSARSVKIWLKIKPLAAYFMRALTFVMARTIEDGRSYCSLGLPASRLDIMGNMKIDAMEIFSVDQKEAYKKSWGLMPETLVIIGGSTWDGEEELLLQIFNKIHIENKRLIIAPRRKERFSIVSELLEKSPVAWSRRSNLKTDSAWNTDILLLDTLGELKSFYLMADIAFIGGTWSKKGGQNPLEPASAGAAILFGPSMENFHAEAHGLVKAGAARQFWDQQLFSDMFIQLAADKNSQYSMAEAGRRYVRAQQGAAKATFEKLKAWI